jgi:molecular chaperone DnaK
MIHNAEKSLKDLAADLNDDEKTNIENAIANLKEVVKGTDLTAMEEKLAALTEVSSKMAERIYAKQGAAQPEAGHEESAAPADEGVLDAEFEEVKDDKK